MTYASANPRAGSPRLLPLRLRRGVALTFGGMVLAACIVAGTLLLLNARKEGQAVQDRVLGAAVALSFGFDQEVAAGNALLRGLSSSPALRSGDPREFYEQLKATVIPAGSWLILQDLDGQVANTLRPFGASLPRHRDFPTYPDALNRVRERGWTVSGRMASLVKPGATVIALSLRIDNDDGSMKGFITTVLSQDRLGAILAQQPLPEGWVSGVYDRRFLPIVTKRGSGISSDVAMVGALQARLTSRDSNSTDEGIVEGLDDRGVPVLAAYRSSGATNWTTVVTVPVALVNAPVRNILWQMAWPAAVLLLVGGLAALFTARHVERPIETLSRQVIEAEDEITQLSEQLLALQEEERQRIARELHDSTAQGLVAANLGLARLGREVEQKSPAARATLAQIEALLDQALQELRTFTYLLHPPNLAEDGLKRTLQEFVGGFAGRAGLRVRIRISDRIDETPDEIQRCILRVVQEALANVHRHAGASQVCVDAKPTGGRLVIRILDDGGGILTPNPEGSERRPRMGVGIPGMRARLRQFGGDLRIRSGAWGTSVVAYVHLPVPSPSAVLAA